MKTNQRIVTRTPLHEVWDEQGVVSNKQLRDLNVSDVSVLLRLGLVRFVVADVGGSLEWVPAEQCYEFWKNRVKEHTADPEKSHNTWDWPDGYFYFASEWESPSGIPIVLLTVHH